jgi:hypothetical protein
MLKTIDDVRRYTSDVAKQFPAIASEIEIAKQAVELPEELVTHLRLPPVYWAIAKANRLSGISIGFFALWPSFVREPLQQSLLQANASGSLVRSFGNGALVAVARYEANPVCVVSTIGDAPDQVFLLDTMSSPRWNLKHIAVHFEQFMVLAANTRRISDVYEGDVVGGQEEMRRCCETLGCTQEQTSFWMLKAAEMLA